MLSRGWYTLATDAIRDCFPSVRIDDVMCCHGQHITQPGLLRLIETVVRDHEGPARTIGLDQGSPYSPIAAELVLHMCLDQELEANDPDYPLLLRYVDNINVARSSAPEGQRVLQRICDILGPQGLALKGTDGDPIDIRDNQVNRKVLGLVIRWNEDHLSFHLPESAYTDLREALSKALNHHQPQQIATSICKGWLSALGPVFRDLGVEGTCLRVMELTADVGIREISPNELIKVAQSSRASWLRLSSRSRQASMLVGG